MNRLLLLLACILGTANLITTDAQAVGIRAGLNYSTISGPLEVGESSGLSNGFHFGFNYGYKFTNRFVVRAELLYTQVGSVKDYVGDGYYKIYLPDGSATIFEKGSVDLNLEVSNAYINVPLVAAYQLTPKFEVLGGLSFNFLVNPIARGTVRFESHDNPDGILFRQALDYRYYQDEAQQGRASSTNIIILVDGERVTLPRFAGAYYQFTDVQKTASTYNWFDVGLVGGVNYFFNKGFYAGATFNYGISDITDDSVDVSLQNLQSDNKFILRDDKDINLSLQISLGFRF